jgi:hypothetical protein
MSYRQEMELLKIGCDRFLFLLPIQSKDEPYGIVLNLLKLMKILFCKPKINCIAII